MLVALGVLSGILTTLAGQGGGLMLLLAASALLGPHAVTRFTLWYTTRPPVHHAVLQAESPPQ